MPDFENELLKPGFTPRKRIVAGELAKHLRITADTKAYSQMLVMHGGDTLNNLLLDAAATIEDSLKMDALQTEKGTIVEADLQNELELLRKETLELNRTIDSLKGEITPLKGEREDFLRLIAERFKKLQKARDALELASIRFSYLSAHDDTMHNGVTPSVGASEAIEAAYRITSYIKEGK